MKLWRIIECLNSNEVEYLAAGALAVSWHGFPRYSADIDFLVRPNKANAERALRAIAQFGFGSLGISTADLDRPLQTGDGLVFKSTKTETPRRIELPPATMPLLARHRERQDRIGNRGMARF